MPPTQLNASKKCLWCPVRFQIKRKRVALCPGCRIKRNRLQQRKRDRERSEERSTILNNVLPMLELQLHPLARVLVDNYLEQRSDETCLPLQMRSAPGTKTASGADEGRSTYYADLAAELDELSAEAANHPWWTDNPAENVFFMLNEDTQTIG